jgi:hypothetical protein
MALWQWPKGGGRGLGAVGMLGVAAWPGGGAARRWWLAGGKGEVAW